MRRVPALLVLAVLMAATCRPAPARGKSTPPEPVLAVPFIADDYSGALAEARAKKLPLFIDTWAPW